MLYPLQDRLFRRELDAGRSRYTSVSGIYGDKHWIDNLDIVNELGGHHGCVNALSWSKSGKLLASGSDDTHILIHKYQSDQSTSPFSLTTSITTGHTANIFSVKFMPHSNDNTIVSAAGDSEVRVFDVEYSSTSRNRTGSTNAFMPLVGSSVSGVKYLREENTNARVYRSHSDRVKRIVTESSPHLFMTCSEDGEVRQWDLRLPSSAYPRPRGISGPLSQRVEQDDYTLPPPLISYKRWRLDLNTISCSANQPHYIVLGGAHLHCFLHDRRMLGRDLKHERGSPASFSTADSDLDEESMGNATRCVRRFAPNGKPRMGSLSEGHVTACKISDAFPNEMVASWSGDHIYSFDLIRSPDAKEQQTKQTRLESESGSRVKSNKTLKRKRPQRPESNEGLISRQRHAGTSEGDIALRVRYENGQSEDIALDTSIRSSAVERVRESMLTIAQRRSMNISKSVVRVRKLLFSLEGSDRPDSAEAVENIGIPRGPFSSALEVIATLLPKMDSVMSSWSYPVDPGRDELLVHRELRQDRDATRRFVQAAGVVSRTLGGVLPSRQSRLLTDLNIVKSLSTEGPVNDPENIFIYDFLKAILAWLQGGVKEIWRAFLRTPGTKRMGRRFPIPENSPPEAVHEYLIAYLTSGAGWPPLVAVDASRFETDTGRIIFPTQKAAVTAFANAIKMPVYTENSTSPLFDSYIPNLTAEELSSSGLDGQSHAVARKFWGFKVARSLLLAAGEDLDFSRVDSAFGGLGEDIVQSDPERDQSEIDPDEEEFLVDTVHVNRRRSVPTHSEEADLGDSERPSRRSDLSATVEDVPDADAAAGSGAENEDEDELSEVDENEIFVFGNSDDSEVDADDDDDEEGDDGDDDDDDGITIEGRQILFRSRSERARLRANVDSTVPVASHSRTYQGHCNIKTVKDVNYFGLNDEYVVSGSDSGHVFIWERATSKLVNILEGDREVVNVIQGHPYEPMLAVSGIDHTIKIFSPDARAQRNARLGINLGVGRNESSGYATLSEPRWLRRPRRNAEEDEQPEQQDPDSMMPLLSPNPASPSRSPSTSPAYPRRADKSDDEEIADRTEGLQSCSSRGLTSRKRMHDQYKIMAQNDIERQSGQRDAFITRSMLTQLAQHVRMRRIGNGGDPDEPNNTLVVDDESCNVSKNIGFRNFANEVQMM